MASGTTSTADEAVSEEGEDEEAGVDDHLGEQHLSRGEHLDQHHADGRPPLFLERGSSHVSLSLSLSLSPHSTTYAQLMAD
jgi:hypothetical protein